MGTHPHVVQNVEWFTQADGRKTLCIYSLGNFISCQVKAGTMLGAMADIVIEQKDGENGNSIAEAAAAGDAYGWGILLFYHIFFIAVF